MLVVRNLASQKAVYRLSCCSLTTLCVKPKLHGINTLHDYHGVGQGLHSLAQDQGLMIRSLELINFKSITTEKPIALENLSIICGSNSSGKSSIIQAILMLSQTFSSRYFKSAISLNGHFVRLGSFKDILDYNALEKNIRFKIGMEFTQPQLWITDIKKATLDYTFAAKEDQNRGIESQYHPNIIKGRATVENENNVEESLSFIHDENPRYEDRLYRVTEINTPDIYSLSKDYPDYKIEGCPKPEILPGSIRINYDHTKKISLQLIPYLTGSPTYLRQIKGVEYSELESVLLPKDFLDKARSLIESERLERIKNFEIPNEILSLMEEDKLRSLNMEKVRESMARQTLMLSPNIIPNISTPTITIEAWRSIVSGLEEKVAKTLFDFLIKNREALQGVWYTNTKKVRRSTFVQLESFTNLDHYVSVTFERNIKYLGPLRNEPQAMYQAFDLSDPTKVGLKGEFAAAVLHINKHKRITYPSLILDENGIVEFKQKQKTLEEACIEWLQYLGVVTSVKTSDKGKLGYELLVKTSSDDEWQDLTHVGVGVSQILPIVLMALLASDDEILIFEQPELHLHPKVQSRLCDFFIAMSSGNIQYIIETHSEYLINRLRLRIVQSRSDDIRNRSSIVFIEKSDGKSSLRTVNISQFGAIQDWPKDFFDQTDIEVENILLEAGRKKREIRSGQESN